MNLPRGKPGERVSVRIVDERWQRLLVRRGLVQPGDSGADRGAMVTVHRRHGSGYCASADLSAAGLQRAAEVASAWAARVEATGLFADLDLHRVYGSGARAGAAAAGEDPRMPRGKPLPSQRELLELLRIECAAMRRDARIVNSVARLWVTERQQWLYVDGELQAQQQARFVEPNLEATASDGLESQTRTLAGQYNGFCRQGGFEVIEAAGFVGAGARIADEALQLLAAPNCPTGAMDLLLAPDQMMLQIHESIGHPLELDRILGDERNFAGTSFVTLDMFGRYRYGSELLNVTFDPTVAGELASYRVDDDGTPAERVHLIRNGILERPLGGALSSARAGARGFPLPPTANSRAVGWHRPPIDRMANLNVEPGEHTLAQMIGAVQRGVLMRTNVSWSIDDARNKFQFGCEWGELIEDGRLRGVVRNPNYRGVSASFWRSLAMVGDRSTFEVMGTPFCGKGEPGQVIRVGHASPACLFRDVSVFGGDPRAEAS
ncbi:MAG TPA: TldD/PmbA family protein [Burkholderiaceae bacterium]|nr:TldD/PmbA family protein [Burkholderiaceae bacterium]